MSPSFPLAPFLASLASDGMRATLDDYERIALTLRCGGPWSTDRLRGILLSILVRDENQEIIFRKRFAEFFALTEAQEVAFAEVDVERALDDLRRLASRPRSRREQLRRERREVASRSSRRRPRQALRALLALVLLALALRWLMQPASLPPPDAPALKLRPPGLVFGKQPLGSETVLEIEFANNAAAPLTVNEVRLTGFARQDYEVRPSLCSKQVLAPAASCRVPVAFIPREEGLRSAFLEVVIIEGSDTIAGLSGTGIGTPSPDRVRIYPNFPRVSGRQDLPLADQDAWQRPTALAALLLLVIVAYGTWLWRWRKPPEDRARAWHADRPRLFRPGMIGAAPVPRLEREILDRVANSLGYFQSELPGKRLDILASVRATAEAGGVPGMIFKRRRQVRRVLILEDTFAEARAFNPIAGELASGLARRGVPVVHGLFRGVPESFRTADGSLIHLEDLEDDRRGYLVLVFSDGKGIHTQRHTFALEALAHWPHVAWLELRERRGWDESAALVARLGLPVFPASREGLLAAMERFSTERASQADFSGGQEGWDGLPVWTPGTALARYVERLLGDSLRWAQASAMAMSPVSLGLTDALRRRFFAELSPERIERLLALPNSSVNAAGLELSTEVLAVLRAGFAVRQPEAVQRRILKFLLGEIRKAEPADRKSPEHQAWEWRYERVRLELEPDAALKPLSELRQGPLGSSIRAELADVVLPSEGQAEALDAVGIPLRAKPRTRRGWQRLSVLAPGAGVPRQKVYTVGAGHWTVLGILGFGLLGALGMALQAVFAEPQPSLEIVGFANPGSAMVVEVEEGGLWRISSTSPSSELEFGRKYRLSMNLDGAWSRYELGVVDQNVELRAEVSERRFPCREKFQDIGLTVERCPPTSASAVILQSWREMLGDAATASSLMSVGLEVRSEEANADRLEAGRGALWATPSVDLVYLIAPAEDGQLHLEEALTRVEADLSPWQKQSQLIFWGAEAEALGANSWGSILALGTQTNWVPALLDLLAPSDEMVVRKPEMLAALASLSASVTGQGIEFTLLRPWTDVGTVVVEALLDRTPTEVALVFLQDGQEIQGTSGTEIELRKGSWQVETRDGGYETVRRMAQIFAGRNQQLTIELVPIVNTGTIRVQTLVDGEPTVVDLAFSQGSDEVLGTSFTEIKLRKGSWHTSRSASPICPRSPSFQAASTAARRSCGSSSPPSTARAAAAPRCF